MTFYPDGSTSRPATPRLPAAGWLPDPSETHLERLWDGSRWTARTRDRTSKVETPASPELAYYPRTWQLEPPRRRFSLGRVMGATVAIVVLGYVGFEYAAGAGYVEPWAPLAAPVEPAALQQPWTGHGLAEDAEPPSAIEVDYPVFGSTDLVRHLEAGMIAQAESIDVSAWMVGDSADAITDAMQEALAQNPAIYSRQWTIRSMGSSAQVEPVYTYNATEAERRRAATRAAAADALVASGALAASSDADKVALIHDWIVNNAAYDYGVFEAIAAGEQSPRVDQSQEAYGILVMGTAVCNGYAMAFTAMAEQAGLDSVVVTGTDSASETGANHAWNKVLIDGSWLLVDATWDDPLGVPEGTPAFRDYLMLEDGDPLLATRTADRYWMVDQNLDAFSS